MAHQVRVRNRVWYAILSLLVIIPVFLIPVSAAPPVANFAANVTEGVIPLAVTFTDSSTNTPTGWAWFFGDEPYAPAWTQVTPGAGWAARQGLTSVVLSDGSIVMAGGATGTGAADGKNDAWRSTDSGVSWTLMNGSSGWMGRQWHSTVALPDDSIVVMGGYGTDYGSKNDVWRSTDKGATWTQMTAGALWPGRYGHSSIVTSNGTIILMGGSASNGVWKSTDNGATWTLVTSSAGWMPRSFFSLVMLPDNSIVLMGGYASGFKNDVWRSTDYGATWTQMTSGAGWTGREYHSSVAMPDGSILLLGGAAPGASREVWRSTDNGATWTQAPVPAWTGRYWHSSNVLPNGSVVLMGGRSPSMANDVWMFSPAGSSLQNPVHTFLSKGIYNVSLQTLNADGFNRTRKTDYILVSDIAANFTWSCNATVPFRVDFEDTSTSSYLPIASQFWNFGDGTSTMLTPKTFHTYPNASIPYNVTLDVWDSLGGLGVQGTRVKSITPCGGGGTAPGANFSATPTTGTAPLAVTFTDSSANTPTGWAWFFGDERYNQPWTQVNASAGWETRYGHTSIVTPDGSIVLMGGWNNGIYYNDTWKSADKGVTWTSVRSSSGWETRSGHTSVVMPDGTIILMGGENNNIGKNDTWRSTDSGATWTRINASSGWPARWAHSSVLLSDGSIVLMGGYDGTSYLNDVWRSTDQGATWTAVNLNSAWARRLSFSSVALEDNSIVLSGGCDLGGYFNDVWRSPDFGASWTRVNASAGWGARSGHSMVVTPDNRIILTGGWDGDSKRWNDVWQSIDNGTTWTQVNGDAGWAGRFGHSSIVIPDGKIVLTGGFTGTWAAPGLKNDVWQLNPVGSSLQNPSHTYTSAGNYTVALQAYNNGGFNSTRKSGYITITGGGSAPVAGFTGSPTSGTAPLSVTFTDSSTNAPTGWSWFFGDENFNQPWVEQTASAAWSGREGHSTVVLPDGSMVLTGGYDGFFYRDDALRSADNGATWTEVHSFGILPDNYGHCTVAQPDGRIILMGGTDTISYFQGVYQSTDRGDSWTVVNTTAEWEGRAFHSCISMPDSSIILMGGLSSSGPLSDVWRSTDNGKTWNRLTSGAGWSARSGTAAVLLPDTSIILMGGNNGSTVLSDVWRSTNLGATWTLLNASAAWSPRSGHNSVAMPDGSIVLLGGNSTSRMNDVWRTTDKGSTWILVNASAGWMPRDRSTSVVLPDGSVVVLGGEDGTIRYNDVWRFNPVGSSARNPVHTYTSAGLFNVTLQAFNTNGYNSTRKSGYITVTGGGSGPVANFAATPASGTVPLTVTFNDTSTNTPTSWNWSFGDGTFGTQQNPTHHYTRAGVYTVSLKATNAGGSGSVSRQNLVRADFASAVMFRNNSVHAGVYDDGGTRPTANLKWNVTTGGSIGSSPTLSDGILYIGSDDGKVYAVNASTGSPIWNATLGVNIVSVPAVADNVLYVGSWNNNLYAVNASDGTVLWSAPTGNYITSSPGVANGMVYIGSHDGSIYAFNATSGIRVWQYATGSDIESSPAVSGGVVYVGSNDQNVYALNASTGTLIWSRPTAGPVLSSPAVAGSAVYAGSYLNHLYCLDAGTGAVVWDYTAGAAVSSSPAVSGGVVYVGSDDKNVYALNAATGAKLWNFTTGGVVYSSPALANGRLYIGSADGSLYVLDPGTGTEFWHYAVGDKIWSSPAVAGGLVFFGSDNRGVYTLGGNPALPLPDFTGTPAIGTVPLAVTFTDLSLNSPTNWNWSFGDGNFSTVRNPAYTYVTAGNYTVSLNATNAAGSNVTTRAGYIWVKPVPAPVVDFAMVPSEGTVPVTVQFTDMSAGSPVNWNWSFGDGSYSDSRNPTHTFTEPKVTDVKLKAGYGSGLSNSTMRQVSAYATQVSTSTAIEGTSMAVVNDTPVLTVNTTAVEESGGTVTTTNTTVTITGANDFWQTTEIYADSVTVNETTQEYTATNTTQVVLQSTPVTAVLNETIGTVSVALDVALKQMVPDTTVNITITQGATTSTASAFQLAASNASIAIREIAYTVELKNTEVINNNLTQNVTRKSRAAIMNMSVSHGWVSRFRNSTNDDGRLSVAIIRYPENGVASVLPTRFIVYDNETNNDWFEADSVEGFSIFGMIGYAAQETAAAQQEAASPPSNSYSYSSSSDTADSRAGRASSQKAAAPPAPPAQKAPPASPAVVVQEKAALATDKTGHLTAEVQVQSVDKAAVLSMPQDVKVTDKAGQPLAEVSIRPDVTARPLADTAQFTYGGIAYHCGPDGAQFDPAIKITFTLTKEQWDALTANGREPVVRSFSPTTGVWEALQTNADATAMTLTADVTHFSSIAVFSRPAQARKSPAVAASVTGAPATGNAPEVPVPKPTKPPANAFEIVISLGSWLTKNIVILGVLILLLPAGYLGIRWYRKKKLYDSIVNGKQR